MSEFYCPKHGFVPVMLTPMSEIGRPLRECSVCAKMAHEDFMAWREAYIPGGE